MKSKVIKVARMLLLGGIGPAVLMGSILGGGIKSLGAENNTGQAESKPYIPDVIMSTVKSYVDRDMGSNHPFGLHENHPYRPLTGAYETPHVKWAKPYAGGEIRALVMAPMWSQRETVELAQRLSLDYTAWMTEAFSRVLDPLGKWPTASFFKPPPALIDRLLREYILKEYDVIVVGKLDWSALPAKQRFELLQKVSEGTGLVYINPPEDNEELKLVFSRKPAPEGADFIRAGVPFSFLPRLREKPAEKIVRTGLFGKGRVVALDYGEKAPDESRRPAAAWPALTPQWDLSDSKEGYMPPDKCPEIELVPYEYYQSLVARAVLWASGKGSKALLGKISLPAIVDYPASARNVEVATVSAPSNALLQASVRSRYDYARVYAIPPRPADNSQIPLPDIPAGEYFLDVWLVASDGKVFDWTSRGFTVQADMEIKEISLAGRGYNPGDAIKGEVRLSRAISAEEVVTAELWDNYGRKISEQRLEGEGDKYVFSFRVTQPLTIMHSIVARVVRQEKDVCVSKLNFPVRARLKWDDFNEIIWCGAGNQFLTHLMLKKLSMYDQADAIDIGWVGATPARNIAAADLAALPYTECYGRFGRKIVPAGKGVRHGPRRGCMSNPETLKGVDRWGKVQSDIYGPYGPLAWTHGDESLYSYNPDTCWSDTCLDALRKYLQEVYPDLSALNREWGREYKTWAEVMPLTCKEAHKTGNYAPWIEHRLAAELVFARFYGHAGQALSVNDPGARAGFDGTGTGRLMCPNGGINMWLLKDYVGIMQDYRNNSEGPEITRSFLSRKHLSGMWYGTFGNEQARPSTVPYHNSFPWYCLLHGFNSTWFWNMGSPGPCAGYALDFTSLPFMQASRDSLREIRTGTGKLLLSGNLQDDNIAIHYSDVSRIADSLYMETAVKSPRSRKWAHSLADFNRAIENSGLQYRYLSYAEVEEDALISRGYKVFIMPHSRAVSEAEAKAIRRFVQAGGLLIADIMPGVLNGHGTPQKESLLADLFPATEPGTVNRIGKGRTVLLGDKLAGYGYASYKNKAGWKKFEGRYRILAQLLEKEAGIKPQIVVTHQGEGEMPPTEIFRIKAGEIEYVGLLREYIMYDNDPYPVSIRFSRKSHLYDVRAGKYLGFTDKVDTVISYEAHLYAMLPYEVASVDISAPDRVARGGSTALKLNVSPAKRIKPALHMLRLEVIGPSGEQLPWYARNITAENGQAEHEIQWALNEKPGKYTLQARDIASGVVGKKTIVLNLN